MQTIAQTPSAMMPEPDRCWQAVSERDREFDGAFVTAVQTTGIYCKPSCPARHPKRENITFLPGPVEARREGYRACKRCKPDEADIDPQVVLVKRASALLDDCSEDQLTLDDLGRRLEVSPHHLQRTFKKIMGISPRQYAEARRIERVKAGLRKGHDVTTALYDAGFGSSSRLYERAPDRFGMTPATYGRGGAGMSISYSIVDSPLGRLLVGTTERGICLVCLGDSDEPLVARLRSEYPNATVQHSTGELHDNLQQVLAYLNGREPRLDLPLDLQATAFQWQAWEALRRIPVGETRSYGEIAAEIGNPKASRAVAQACANNPVALVIPCHRVVRSDGAVGGYRWGTDRKEALLASERQMVAGE